MYHRPVALNIVFILSVFGVPALCHERHGLVRRELPAEAVDVVAQVFGDDRALFVERQLGIVGDGLADGDDRVLLLEVNGIEFDRFLRLAVVQAGDVDEALLQIADKFRVAPRRLGEDDQIVALHQRLDALLEGLDDVLVVIDGDRVGVDQKRREHFGDDTRDHAPEPFGFARSAEKDIMVGVVGGFFAVERAADRPCMMLALEVERHHDRAADRGVIADKYSGLVARRFLIYILGMGEAQAQNAADKLVINVACFHIRSLSELV